MKKSTNLKKVMTLFAAIVIVFAFMTVAVSAKTASDAKNSVVAIQSQDGSGLGTGFAIGEKGKPVEYIVTNNHVVNGGVNTMATVYFNLAANKQMLANICYYNEVKDIAILRLPELTEERVPLILCKKENLNPDDEYFALGYPGNSLEITEWLQFSTSDITVTRGGIKKNDTYEGVDVFYLDLDVTHGNSGGPLVNSKGELAGIIRGSVFFVNQAIAVDELIRILKHEEIPFALSDDINWLIIIGGAALLLIIILVIVLVVRKSSKPQTQISATSAVQNGSPAGQTVGLQQQAQQAQQAQAPTVKLIAVSGPLANKNFSISGKAVMGRDPARCTVVFPANTGGVSAAHCEVAFDGSACYVKDLGSSYGTFTMDGKKLTPNVPQILKSGDKFFLAATENTFEVRY